MGVPSVQSVVPTEALPRELLVDCPLLGLRRVKWTPNKEILGQMNPLIRIVSFQAVFADVIAIRTQVQTLS